MRSVSVVALLSLVLGCTPKGTDPQPEVSEVDAPEPPGTEPSAPEPPGTEPPATEPPATEPLTNEELPEPVAKRRRRAAGSGSLTHKQRVQIASALGKGRRAVREGDYSRALDLYEQGLAIDRQQPTMLCEAGWAAFLGEDPRAEQLLLEGSELSPPSPGRGACLYNLGRVYERAGETARAANLYADSLDWRPSNRETLRRYRTLTGKDYDARACPPSGPFASAQAFCDALWDIYAAFWYDPENPPQRPSQSDDELQCGRVKVSFPVEGPALGDLVLIEEPEPDGRPYWTHYLLLARDGKLEPLGRVGTSIGRACSVGFVEIERARWQTDGEVRLIVELHAESAYSCNETTPRQDCEAKAEDQGKPTTHCESLSDDYPAIEVVDERYKMICAELDGQLRCSAPAEYPSKQNAVAARFDPLPSGAALTDALVCPHQRLEMMTDGAVHPQ
jgi:hypothetical protein